MMPPVLRLIRPADWVKNVFVLPALLFGARRSEPEAVALMALAFVAFCLVCSGIYSLNDVVDAERDRAHPVKRRRPVASGAIGPRQAVVVGVGAIALGLALGFSIGLAFAVNLLIYLLLQVGYNLGLKRIILVDVVIIALGFSLRAAAGALAIDVPISPWLLLCVFFLCLYLGFIKRLCDLASAEAEGNGTWRSPAGYDDRSELNWLLGVSAVLAIVTYLMYSMSGHVLEQFGPRAMGFSLLSPLVLIAVHRFYRRASTGLSDSPFSALRNDPVVMISILLFAGAVAAMIYITALDGFFGALLDAPSAGRVGP